MPLSKIGRYFSLTLNLWKHLLPLQFHTLAAKGRLKKESKKNLVSEHSILKTVMENTRAHLAYLDPNFNLVLVNKAYAKGCGYSQQYLIGKNHFDLFPNSENQSIFEKVKKTGKAIEYRRKPFRFVHQPQRGITYWDWTLTPIKNRSQNVIGLVLSLVDVTEDVLSDKEREDLLKQLKEERKRVTQFAEEAERKASEMDVIIKAIANPVLVCNEKGVYIKANPAAVKMFGTSPVGRNLQSVVGSLVIRRLDGTIPDVKDLPSNRALKGQVVSDAFIIISARGKEMVSLASAAPLRRGRKIYGAVIILHDISERERLERQKNAFIAIASHELKTPVTILKAFLQILQQSFEKIDKNKSFYYLEKMSFQMDRLTGLINELLDVSRIETGKLELHEEKVDINQLVKEIVEDIQSIAENHKIILRGSSKRKIRGDRDRLSQVVVNLLMNAIKYSPSGGRIIVKIALGRDKIVISVKDSGIGISKENQTNIFERFFRVEGARGEQFPGLGLGLFISSEIIKRHGGKIWVKSKVGKGSTFYFSLPF